MKICILTHGVMPFGRQYATHFRRRGHDVELFSLTPCEPLEGVPTRIFGKFNADGGSRLEYLRIVLPVRAALRRFSPDVAFAMYLSSAGVVGALAGHKRLVLCALGSDVNLRVDSRVWRNLLRWACRRSVLVHAVSDPLAEQLRDRLGVAPSRILVSPVGVDTRLLALVDPAARPRAGRILSMRAHAPLYDQPTLIRALAILKERGVPFHATFAHRGSEATRRCAAELGVEESTTFLPGFAPEELPTLLGSHDVYVSSSRSDGTSQSLLEALSTGLFPVVSDIPANRPWVEHGRSGLLFPVGKAEVLADRLAEAFADAGLRASAARINRSQVVARGDSETEADRLLEAFHSICKAERSQRNPTISSVDRVGK